MSSLKRRAYHLFGMLETLGAGAFLGAVVLGIVAAIPMLGDFIPDATADRWGAGIGFVCVLAVLIAKHGKLTSGGHC